MLLLNKLTMSCLFYKPKNCHTIIAQNNAIWVSSAKYCSMVPQFEHFIWVAFQNKLSKIQEQRMWCSLSSHSLQAECQVHCFVQQNTTSSIAATRLESKVGRMAMIIILLVLAGMSPCATIPIKTFRVDHLKGFAVAAADCFLSDSCTCSIKCLAVGSLVKWSLMGFSNWFNASINPSFNLSPGFWAVPI